MCMPPLISLHSNNPVSFCLVMGGKGKLEKMRLYMTAVEDRDSDLHKLWSDVIPLELGLRNYCLCSHNSCSNKRSINLSCSGQSSLFVLCYLRVLVRVGVLPSNK